ncbi:asparagine synthase (glutamine-hydrolyzing) [Anabaenopsis elenkinii]|uniref:asparagine synthase (glutamine-hydrolyzing) n=1 Tax=Anabaenopsis elenkinii CCIBt3563 TaxID=2779889 RepID=A0A7S6REA7_9CYAN|nr:asparagine synthase (glutamine-hydrolyzing) [Anabaenopsis elenkinii]QOV23349.1 asparagine synthase (glutamine-hydrolyzing) [Anabaenopsis elenkinii CCIBt3563]
MCGIAGILNFQPDHQNLETQINRMQAALQHRGPDDTGIYIAPSQQAALAHTRLSIIDLTAAGHQPMSTPDHRYHITFNGEIYNFQQLRKQLISQGETFHSQTDTEVIIKLYQKLGVDCVHHLRGMFAFAIWDDVEKTCFLARDPLGIKPLYYYQSGHTLVFASELRAVLASGLPQVNISLPGLYGYLTTGSVPEPHTLIADIHCLAAGNWLYWQGGNTTKKQYWELNFTPQAISPGEAQEIVHTALLDSINHHFISDVPVGIFLSGGIDSTSVLALATQTQTSQISTYSIAFAESAYNEGELAQKIAHHFGADHTEYQVTASFAKNILPKFLRAIDQPSIDGFNTFCVSQVAHEQGMKVVLSGLGGDEIFGGYQSFQKIPQMVAWGQKLHALPLLSTSLGVGLAGWGNSPKIKRLGDFLSQSPSFVSAYRSFRGIFSHTESCRIIEHLLGTKFNYQEQLDNLDNLDNYLADDHFNPEDQVSFLEITGYMRNQLLRDSDVMSMNWGLELRVPLVDQALIAAVAPIPSHIRLQRGKKLLVDGVGQIPDWVVNRPKKGFHFPFESWMNDDFGDYFQNLNIPDNISLKPWYRRWSLAILRYWLEEVVTG